MSKLSTITSACLLALFVSPVVTSAYPQQKDSLENRNAIMKDARYSLSIYKYDKAIMSLSSLVKPGVFDEDLQSELANCYFQSARYDKSLELYKALSDSVPDQVLYRIRKMLSNYKLGNYSSCIEEGHQILQNDSIPTILNYIGDSFQKEGRPDSALWYYERSLVHRPEYEPVIIKAATISLDSKQYERVLSLTEAFSKDYPDNTTILPMKGVAHYWLEEYDDAIKIFEHQKEIGNGIYSTHFFLGQSYWRSNQIYRAEEELLKAWQLDSTKANLAYTIAAVKSEGRHPFNEVTPWLDKAYKLLQPDSTMVSRVYQQYGYEYCKLKEWEKAKLYYTRALCQTPFSVIVMYNIGYCFEMMNDYRQALIWYNKALTYAKDEKSRTMLTQRIEDLKREIFMTS